MERKHNRGIGMSHKSILSRIRGPIQTSYADNIMSSKQTAIFTWSIPQGGLPKVILKEYYYFKEKNSSAFILSLNPIPNAYFNDFAKVGSEHCIVADHNLTSKIINISDFLPGLEVSMRGSLLRNVIALIHHLRIRNPSVIIAHQLLSAYLLMPYCLIYRKPYVVVLHDNPFMFIEEKNLKKMSIIRRFQATLVYLFSNIVILASKSTVCTTTQIKKEVQRNLRLHKPILVAEYGIDSFPMNPTNCRKILLTVSKWSEFRNPNAYLDLLSMLPTRINLVMAGRWDNEIELENFKVEAKKRALGEQLILKCNVSEEELSSLYDQTRIFVRLGFKEKGTGQSILEAIGHGCPVVLSRCLGAASMVIEGKNGFLVDENNLVDVARIITEIYDNDQVIDRMSKFSYEIGKGHSWQEYLDTIYFSTI